MNKKRGTLLLIIAAIAGGIAFVAMKYLLDSGFTSIQCIAGRYIVAVAFMSVFYKGEFKKITAKELKGGAIMGTLLFLLFVLLMEGLERTTPSVNAFLGGTASIMVPIILWAVFKKRPDKYVAVGAVMTVVGVGVMSLTGGFEINLGAVLSLGASVVFAAQMVVMDKYVADCDPTRLTLVESIFVMIFSFATAVVSKEALPSPNRYDVIVFIFSGVFCTFIYFLFQSIGQKYTSPTSASIIISSEAVFAAVASAIFYGEAIGARVVVGGTLIFAAAVIAEVKPQLNMSRLLTNRAK